MQNELGHVDENGRFQKSSSNDEQFGFHEHTLMTELFELKQRLCEKAADLGFSFVGVVPATPSRHLAAYHQWIASEMHGAMGYLARPDRQIRRNDLNEILPQVRSLICVGFDYFTDNLPDEIANDPSRGRISNYAWGTDYHDIMQPRLEELAR